MKLLRIFFLSLAVTIYGVMFPMMQASSLEGANPQEMQEVANLLKQDLPIVVQLLGLQESLCERFEAYRTQNSSREELVKQIRGLDELIIHFTSSWDSKLKGAPKLVEVTLDPLYAYKKALMALGSLSLTLDERIKMVEHFFNNYQSVRKVSRALYLSIVHVAEKKVALPGLSADDKEEKKDAIDAITKEELGFEVDHANKWFASFLINIANALEFQELCYDIIILRAIALKKIKASLEIYKETIEKTNLIERENESIDQMALRGGSWHFKPFITIEGYYLSYLLGIMSKDHQAYAVLEAFSLPFLNHPNQELKDIAQLGVAKSRFNGAMDSYCKCVLLYLKFKEGAPIIDVFTSIYSEQLRTGQKMRQAKLFPSALLRFILTIDAASEAMNRATNFLSFKKGVEESLGITQTFIEEYCQNREQYYTNYKRLKLTFRKPAIKCHSQTFTATYLANSSLSEHSLSSVEHTLTLDMRNIIRRFRAEEVHITPPGATEIPTIVKSQGSSEEKKKKKKKKKNRKKNGGAATVINQGERNKQNESEGKEQCGEGSPPKGSICVEKPKNSLTVFLQDKKIAKCIQDKQNDMAIYVYRLKDDDIVSEKIIIFDERVQQWFANPESALKAKQFDGSDPRMLNSIAFHSFAKEVDKYALKWGFKRKAINKKNGKEITEIFLPGIIERHGKRYEGLFGYAIDAKYLCFHRFFTVCDWRNKLATEWYLDIED